MEYKEWHDADGNEFHSQKRVYFSDASINKTLSLHELCRLSADVAVEDYRARGMSREFLAEHGVAILVSRNSYRIHTWPKENQNIELVTWEEKPQALQLVRCYKVVDESGALLVSGKSTWLVVDLNNRRLMPTKNFTLRTAPTVQREMDCMEPAKISSGDDLQLWDTHKIKFSDLDSNGHTTNSRYAAFVEDALPKEFQDKTICDFRLNYSKEAMLGDELSVYGKIDSESNKIVMVGKTAEFVSFEAEIFF